MPSIVEDWQWVVLTIIQEAALESLKGKTMVAEVIRDRTETKYNSDGTVPGTILRSMQFSGWNTSNIGRIAAAKLDLSHPAVVDSMTAYNIAFKERSNLAMGANLYHADYMNPYPEWVYAPNVKRLTQEGHHIFYLEKV